MPFPGLKLIDDILAGLPENARLRAQLAELKLQIAALQEKNEALEAKLAELERKHSPNVEAVAILKLLFDRAEEVTREEIGERFPMKKSICDHHLDVLKELELIRQSSGLDVDDPEAYSITPEGRAFIVEKKTT